MKIGGIWFFGGQKPPIKGLTIIERSWNYGNLPYLVANTYGFNFVQIRGIWIFQREETPIRGGYIWPAKPIFELGWAIPVKSRVKIWFGLVEMGSMLIFRGAEAPLLVGVTCDLWCTFSNLSKLFQSKVMCENLVWISWGFQELSW